MTNKTNAPALGASVEPDFARSGSTPSISEQDVAAIAGQGSGALTGSREPDPQAVPAVPASIPSAFWQHLVSEIEADPNPDFMGAEYWKSHAERPFGPLIPLGKPCSSCAVVERFYSDLSYELSRQPAHIVAKVCSNWFCHDNPTRACRGNIEFVAYLRDRDASLAEDAGTAAEPRSGGSPCRETASPTLNQNTPHAQ